MLSLGSVCGCIVALTDSIKAQCAVCSVELLLIPFHYFWTKMEGQNTNWHDNKKQTRFYTQQADLLTFVFNQPNRIAVLLYMHCVTKILQTSIQLHLRIQTFLYVWLLISFFVTL